MSADERILRLENAFATLSELAARAEEADRRHEEDAARHREAAARHEESGARHEARLKDIAESIRILVELMGRHDERMDELRALHADSERKIAALADAQIRAEDGTEKLRAAQVELGTAQAELKRAQAELAVAQTRTETALERLSETVDTLLRNGRGGPSPG